MTWKNSIAVLAVLALALLCLKWRGERTYRVPRLHGGDLYLKESELHRLTPLGWAMMLDVVDDAASRAAYERQCRKDPGLARAVEGLFGVKAKIAREGASRKR